MANLAYTVTVTSGTTASAADIETGKTDVKTWLNNRDNATDYWLKMFVSGTASNPAEIKSSAADCEFDIDSTGSSGTPRVSWRRSGTTYFTAGVDGAASNLFKFGTTALTTNVAFQIPTTGVQTQFAVGSAATPSMSFIGFATTGMYKRASGGMSVSVAGTDTFQVYASAVECDVLTIPGADNTINLGQLANRWKEVFAGTGTINTSHSIFKRDIQDIEDFMVPRGVTFKWKDREGKEDDRVYMGFLADNLPAVAFAYNESGEPDKRGVHLNAVVGILCSAVRKLQREVEKLTEKLI